MERKDGKSGGSHEKLSAVFFCSKHLNKKES